MRMFMLPASAFVLATVTATPAFARDGGQPTKMDSFDGPGDLGAHFSQGGNSYPAEAAGESAWRGGGFLSGGYPGYYRRSNCTRAFAAQHPELCR
jgi:hypothetical protein